MYQKQIAVMSHLENVWWTLMSHQNKLPDGEIQGEPTAGVGP
jgi:hypothetical protein